MRELQPTRTTTVVSSVDDKDNKQTSSSRTQKKEEIKDALGPRRNELRKQSPTG